MYEENKQSVMTYTEQQYAIATNSIEYIKQSLDIDHSKIKSSSLNLGLPGISLFYYYYSAFSQRGDYKQLAEKLLSDSISNLSNSLSDSNFKISHKTDSIDNHLASMGRFLLFVENNLDHDLETESFLNDLDWLLLPLLKNKLINNDHDLESGSLASGYYFLARYKYSGDNPKFKVILSQIVESLIDSAIFHESGGAFWRSPSLNNSVFLGLSHGSAMVINFLSDPDVFAIAPERISLIIEKAIDFLLFNRRDFVGGIFPHCYYAKSPEAVEATQLSQCYGDLGVAYSLFKGSNITKRTAIRETAWNLLLECSQRKKQNNLTFDASLVYGASGLSCIFSKLNDLTAQSEMAAARDYWFEKIPSYTGHDTTSGFKTGTSSIDEPDFTEINASFSWGISGIGITLIHLLDPKATPRFDELQMVGF